MLGVEVDLKVKFETNKNGDKIMLVTIDDDPPVIFEAFDVIVPSLEDMSSYTGRFYSPELETSYVISVKNEKLSCHHPRHGDFEIKILKKDILEGHYPVNLIKYKRDENGAITGILVTNGRVRNLWFEKQ